MCFACGVEKRSKTKTGTTEEFIKKAIEKHGKVYDYSQVIFKKCMKKVKIICSKHGIFEQVPNNHLQGQGCPKCGVENNHLRSQLSTDEFIKRSQKIHKNKYNYDKSIYRGWENKINIKCLIHGIFEQKAGDHLMGAGCSKCGRMGNKIFEKTSLEEFISRSNNRHNNKYDYNKVVYENNRTKVIIICPVHGEFLKNPDNHLRLGGGCLKCLQEKRYEKSQKKFIEKAKKINANLYDYSESQFRGYKKKIKIICLIHGPFFQTPDSHLKGAGCPHCILKQEHRLGVIIKEIFKGWKIKGHKKLYSKEHKGYRTFDFFATNGEERVIIEYDGLQHFKPIRFSYKMTQAKAESNFKKQQETDKLDFLFCYRKGFKIYRVSYRDNMRECIKKIYESFFK
jgi:hypothetical protein